jgi:lysozyme
MDATQLSAQGLRLIQLFEQCRLAPYQDSRGFWTVGWGHALTDGNGQLTKDHATAFGAMARMGYGGSITQAQADALLQADLAPRVAKVVAETSAATQGELDAMVSLFFNIGEGGFATSHVRAFHNSGNRAVGSGDIEAWAQLAKGSAPATSMASAFVAWCKADGAFSLGLFRRRACELLVYRGTSDVDAIYSQVEAFHA